MEGDLRPGKMHGDDDQARSNSDTSSLTAAEYGKDTLRKVLPGSCIMWTNEKHNLYLNHLEVSFIELLHQSKGWSALYSEQYSQDISISQKHPINTQRAPDQFTALRNGCGQKIKLEAYEPVPSTSADSHVPFKSQSIHRFKHLEIPCPRPTADMQGFFNPCYTEEHEKVISHGSAKCSQEYNGDSFDLTREGSGQNFLDDDNQSRNNVESPTKRLRTALASDWAFRGIPYNRLSSDR